MIDSNFATFVSVEIINPSPKAGFSLNLSEKAMKKDGADINLIAKYTGLSVEEIRKLRPDGEKL